MIGNRVDTSLPQGIACYGCVDSIITDNVLTTLPGSRFRTYLRVIGGSKAVVMQNHGVFTLGKSAESALKAGQRHIHDGHVDQIHEGCDQQHGHGDPPRGQGCHQ